MKKVLRTFLITLIIVAIAIIAYLINFRPSFFGDMIGCDASMDVQEVNQLTDTIDELRENDDTIMSRLEDIADTLEDLQNDLEDNTTDDTVIDMEAPETDTDTDTNNQLEDATQAIEDAENN